MHLILGQRYFCMKNDIRSAHLDCRVLASLIVLVITSQRFRPVCWEMKHSDISASSFGTVGRFKVLLEKENNVSMKLASRQRHEVLLNLLVDGAVVDSGLHQPMTRKPKSSLTVGTGIVDCVLLGSLSRLWEPDLDDVPVLLLFSEEACDSRRTVPVF